MKRAVKEAIMANLMDGCVLRIARYQYACAGDGTPNTAVRKFSYVCRNTIRPRDKYIEFEPQPHSAGSRHCLPCAELFLARKSPEACPFCNHPAPSHNQSKGCTEEVKNPSGFNHVCVCDSGDGKTRD